MAAARFQAYLPRRIELEHLVAMKKGGLNRAHEGIHGSTSVLMPVPLD